MHCREAQKRLLEAERLEGRLPESLEAHLHECATCSALRAQLSTLDEVIREQAPELPDGFELSLRRRLKQHGRRWVRRRRRGVGRDAGRKMFIGIGIDRKHRVLTFLDLTDIGFRVICEDN